MAQAAGLMAVEDKPIGYPVDTERLISTLR